MTSPTASVAHFTPKTSSFRKLKFGKGDTRAEAIGCGGDWVREVKLKEKVENLSSIMTEDNSLKLDWEQDVNEWLSKCALLNLTIKSLLAQCGNRTARFEQLCLLLHRHWDEVNEAWAAALSPQSGVWELTAELEDDDTPTCRNCGIPNPKLQYVECPRCDGKGGWLISCTNLKCL